MASFMSFNIGAKDIGTQMSAIQLFTDREEPREAFERKLRTFSSTDWRSFSCILSFYGVGGVGKTWLKNHLRRVLDNDPDCPRVLPEKTTAYHIAHDFEDTTASADKRIILTRLRKQLGDVNPNFSFYLFDTALLIFAKKQGLDLAKDSSASLVLENNPWLNTAITGLGAMPVVGWASNLIQSLDSAAGLMRNGYREREYKKKYSEKLDIICRSDPDDILRELHIYFAIDMKENMVHIADKPLVIFLDTYEKYADTLTKDTLSLISDYWLRKDSDSLIKSIPGVMWVILGRERLKWDEDDESMRSDIPERPLDKMSEEEKFMLSCELLEQHLIGNLSESDTFVYLDKVGLRDEALRKHIYSLSQGTPLLLDMCVKRYNDLKTAKKVTIEDIGLDADKLISRYLSHMVTHFYQLSLVLAVLGKWDDEMAFRIVPQIPFVSYFTKDQYTEYMSHSFVIHQGDGIYYLHDSVRKACLEDVPFELVSEVNRKLAAYYEEKMSQLEQDLSLSDCLVRYIDAVFCGSDNWEEAYSHWSKIVYYLNILDTRGDYKNYLRCVNIAYNHVQEKYFDTNLFVLISGYYAEGLRKTGHILEAFQVAAPYKCLIALPGLSEDDFLILMNMVYMTYSANGKYEEALPIIQFVSEKNAKLHGEEDPLTLQALTNLAAAYDDVGNWQEALAINQKVVEQRIVISGENDSDTLIAMNNLAISLDNAGQEKEALALFQKIFERRKATKGENHPETLSSMNNLTLSYRKAGHVKESILILEDLYEKRVEILGEAHPDTINTFDSLAESYEEEGQQEKAAKISARVYALRKSVLGDNHPDTIAARHNLELLAAKKDEEIAGNEQFSVKIKDSVDDDTTAESKIISEDKIVVHSTEEKTISKEKIGKASKAFEKGFSSLGKNDSFGKRKFDAASQSDDDSLGNANTGNDFGNAFASFGSSKDE